MSQGFTGIKLGAEGLTGLRDDAKIWNLPARANSGLAKGDRVYWRDLETSPFTRTGPLVVVGVAQNSVDAEGFVDVLIGGQISMGHGLPLRRPLDKNRHAIEWRCEYCQSIMPKARGSCSQCGAPRSFLYDI